MANTNSTRTKATVTEIDLGLLQIDGLLLPDNQYAVSVSQTAELFSFDTNQASRGIKPLLGEGFQFDMVASELNSKKVTQLQHISKGAYYLNSNYPQ